MSSPRTYTLLARYYDQFFTFHLEWYRQARRRLLGEILPQVRVACDIACGTGTTALEFAQRGIKVYGVDLSPTMCRLARTKAGRAAKIAIILGDMRTFRLPEPVDLITCEFDALNHVQRKSDLARVAKSVARALRPGGYFYFDVNNRLAFKKIWMGTTSWFEKPGLVMVMRGGYDERRDKGSTDVDWFIRQKGCWRRFHERVEQVAWTRKEVLHTLRAAGFHCVRAHDATEFFRGDSRIRFGCRTFYVAQRQVR